ncbi:hypothetical protein [Selenomonas ruminantium]|uniref:DUF3887 domain-containing protein n=1 Tax=Selenomonas ruminantium TaxID=971 RepID=A0A1H0RAL8_SELRU|nr:hypothetical protein [Selenomonas ruminantium]SDP26440.1 hypothetical protein SAMN05216366_11144 [Selenomonas ruminantium]
MKKKVVALVLGAMMSFSAMAMAATPEAEMMSAQQAKVAAWTDVMLVKNKPTDALKLMSSEAQKEITAKKITDVSKEMAKNLGKFKGARFVSWTVLDQCQMMYLMSFEKEPIVRCVFIFDQKGNMLNFALQPIKQKQQAPQKPQDKAKPAPKK